MKQLFCRFYFLLIVLLGSPASSWALLNPYVYLNYVQDLRIAGNSATSLQRQEQAISNQLHALRYQSVNTQHVSNYQWRNITSLINRLDHTSRQGQALSYSAANIDERFRHTYPDYVRSPYGQMRYSTAYRQWNASTLDTLRATLDAAGMNANDFQNEQETLEQLKQQGETAQGRMQALQVSSELAADNVNQLQELKRLIVAQTNAQNAYMAYRVSKDSYNEHSLKEIDDHMPSQFPTYRNNVHFGVIPNQ